MYGFGFVYSTASAPNSSLSYHETAKELFEFADYICNLFKDDETFTYDYLIVADRQEIKNYYYF